MTLFLGIASVILGLFSFGVVVTLLYLTFVSKRETNNLRQLGTFGKTWIAFMIIYLLYIMVALGSIIHSYLF